MIVASRRKARLLAARQRRRPQTSVQGNERWYGPYRVGAAAGNGCSGDGFWLFFDWLPKAWRDRINYALNPSGVIATYGAASAECYQDYIAAEPSGFKILG